MSSDERQVENSRPRLRTTIAAVAALNLSYFGIEFSVATAVSSVALYADSIDFLEDASVNLLILLAVGWSARARARVGMLLALILLAPGAFTLWTAWRQWSMGTVPAAGALTVTGLGALAINLGCAFLLVKVRHVQGSLTRAAFLSARNDTFANIAIIGAGGVTALTLSRWPDLLVGLGIFAMNLDAAREVYAAAREEHRLADAQP